MMLEEAAGNASSFFICQTHRYKRETVCDISYGDHAEVSEQERTRLMEKERGYCNETHLNLQPLKRGEQLTFIHPTDALTARKGEGLTCIFSL